LGSLEKNRGSFRKTGYLVQNFNKFMTALMIAMRRSGAKRGKGVSEWRHFRHKSLDAHSELLAPQGGGETMNRA
jgi:hypothetical protein